MSEAIRSYGVDIRPNDSITLQRPGRDHVWGAIIGNVSVASIDHGACLIAWPPAFQLPDGLPLIVSLWHGRTYVGMAELHVNGLRRV